MIEVEEHGAKTVLQKDVLKKWALSGYIGTAQLCTGSGKTKVALMAIEQLLSENPNAKIMIVTPTEVIRDDVFPNEFRKWGMGHMLEVVEIACIQTVYKYTGKVYDLVIADEIHNYLTEHYGLFFNNTVHRLLGLSAWIPEDKRELIVSVAPIVYTLTTDAGVKMGIISPYVEYNIPVTMSPVESVLHSNIQREYIAVEQRLGGATKAFPASQAIRSRFAGRSIGTLNPYERASYLDAVRFRRLIQERRKFLYEHPGKIPVIREILDKFGITKSVIFSQSVSFADTVAKYPDVISYHSKSADRSGIMERFMSEDGVHLSACMAVNEGMDLPKLPVIIIASRVSSPKVHIQRRGRCLRFEEGKLGIIFNLYIPGTQDEKWLMRAQQTTNKLNIKWVKSLDDIDLS
jgi:superfamily II DNA or RNA helicase